MGGDPDLGRALAVGLGAQDRLVEVPELALVVDRLDGRPEQADHLDGLDQPRGPAVVGQAVGQDVLGLADADAEHGAPVAEVVERQEGLREHRGRRRIGSVTAVPSRMRSVWTAAAAITGIGSRNACGLRTTCGHRHQVGRPDARREPVQKVVRPPDGVEAGLLAGPDAGDRRVERRADTAVGADLERAHQGRRLTRGSRLPPVAATEGHQPCRRGLERGDDHGAAFEPRRSAELVVTSATTGPTRTRTRPPTGTSDPTWARMRLRVESSPEGSVVAMETSQGCTTAPTGPVGPAAA